MTSHFNLSHFNLSHFNLFPENYRTDIQAELEASPAYLQFSNEARSRLYTREELQQLELDNPGYDVSSTTDWTEIIVEVTPKGEIINPPGPFASRAQLERRYILNRAGRYPNNRYIPTFIPGLLPEFLTAPSGIEQYANRVMATRDSLGKPISPLPTIPISGVPLVQAPIIPRLLSIPTTQSRLPIPPIIPRLPSIPTTQSRLPSIPTTQSRLPPIPTTQSRLPPIPTQTRLSPIPTTQSRLSPIPQTQYRLLIPPTQSRVPPIPPTQYRLPIPPTQSRLPLAPIPPSNEYLW